MAVLDRVQIGGTRHLLVSEGDVRDKETMSWSTDGETIYVRCSECNKIQSRQISKDHTRLGQYCLVDAHCWHCVFCSRVTYYSFAGESCRRMEPGPPSYDHLRILQHFYNDDGSRIRELADQHVAGNQEEKKRRTSIG